MEFAREMVERIAKHWRSPDARPRRLSRTTALLSRIEDAGLNASAPPQQRWLDGWLLRFSPGKAKRARCINAVAPGRLPVADKLALCAQPLRRRRAAADRAHHALHAARGLDALLDALGCARSTTRA